MRLTDIAPRLGRAQEQAIDEHLRAIHDSFTPDANDWRTVSHYASEALRLIRARLS